MWGGLACVVLGLGNGARARIGAAGNVLSTKSSRSLARMSDARRSSSNAHAEDVVATCNVPSRANVAAMPPVRCVADGRGPAARHLGEAPAPARRRRAGRRAPTFEPLHHAPSPCRA